MAKQRTHLYEGMYILSATLSDEARQKALEKITLIELQAVVERFTKFSRSRTKKTRL